MRSKINYIGMVIGRLTVLSRLPNSSKDSIWLCVCDCGNTRKVNGSGLRRKTSRSCGCLQKELLLKRTYTHGKTKTPEFKAWQAMKSRCYNSNVAAFPNYGGRGITVCQRWQDSFENFFQDMGARPSPLHSLDRFPDVNGNYEPSNCRWGTIPEQHRNKRNNNWVEYEGTKMVVQDWAIKFGIPQATLDQRLRRGKTVKEVMDFSRQECNKGKYLIQ